MKNNISKIVIILYSFSAVWWITIFARGIKNTTENYLFNIPMAVVPMLAGGYVVYQVYKNRQEYEHAAIRAMFFSGTGLLFWGTGNLAYLYYNLHLSNPAPYMLFPDIFYSAASILWSVGLFYILIISGYKQIATYGMRRLILYLLLFFACVLIIYVVLVNQLILPDLLAHFTYDVFYISLDFFVFFELCVLLYILFLYKKSRFMVNAVFIFVGFVFNYIADVAYILHFQYFFVASWIDFTFYTGAFFQGLGVLLLLDNTVLTKVDKKYEAI